MERIVKSGNGWRLGWHSGATVFKGLVGGNDWSLELTEPEFNDFRRLTRQLVDTMAQMAQELMEEERIACEASSDLVWLEAEGFPHAYSLHLVVLTGRRAEVQWTADAVPALVQATQAIEVF